MDYPPADLTVRPIRTILAPFENDPDWGAPGVELPTTGLWQCRGKTSRVLVYLRPLDAQGRRVLGGKATVGGFFVNKPATAGVLGSSPIWDDAGRRAGVRLDVPLVFFVSAATAMGVRVSDFADMGAATKLVVSVQEMPL